MLCSICNKMPAVIFISIGEKMSNPKGICIRCAKKMNTESIYDLMKDYKPTEEEINTITSKLFTMISEINVQDFQDEMDELGGAVTFPVPKNLFSELSFNKNFEAKNDRNSSEKIKKNPKKKFVEMYCDNLTKKAKSGKLGKIIGRESEIDRVIQILCRRTKNNPCLTGEPGVGKTAIAEGLALRIVSGNIPFRLRGREVCLLDLTALVAGTQFRGQFESRIKGLIDEVKSDGKIILFIDEVHNLVGVGDSEGSMTAANILKPALSRGEIQVIGATTFKEYRKYIERDAALERRFQQVKVVEPSIEKATALLLGIKDSYEEFHRVVVPEFLVGRIVVLSERYINDRFLPDKAIDLLDESCACAALSNSFLEKYDDMNEAREKFILELEKLTREAERYSQFPPEKSHTFRVKNKKELELDSQPEFNIDAINSQILNIKQEISLLNNKIEQIKQKAFGKEVKEDDVSRVIELWTGIPATKILQSEFIKLKSIEEILKHQIKGQDEAVRTVCNAIKRNRTRINPKILPSSFIFVGSTGVGKTELVKVLANELFGDRDNLIRLDMSEFMEKHAVSRIIGSPPGYIGFDDAGQITEKVRQKPYSIILFDEIEKAHPDVLNILLQIMDEGKISDSHGRIVSFENTIIVMTSNAGSDKTSGVLGFDKNESELKKEKVMKALSDFLKPEFLSRVDEVVVFNNLKKEDLIDISRLTLNKFKNHLKEKGITFNYDENSIRALVEKLKKDKNGARGIKNIIRKEVEDKLADLIVRLGSFDIGNMVLSASPKLYLNSIRD
ncbi:MAG: ATP-dependent Clp protease ATP-binding subunit [Candidatus Improbicoccus devescovinae]|nr:MAG: ATP-dependent Clp protease ATP-binding subunit [Candidatus Improbicoccus devescovinae]